jgi:hypothetical protein
MATGGREEYNRPVTSGIEQEAPRPGGVFVGRERELSELEAGLDEAEGGRGSLFLVVGEPGIGKSRLAEEVAARTRERGFLVLWGRCWEAGGAPAYLPWVQALRAHVRATDPEDLAEQLGAQHAICCRWCTRVRGGHRRALQAGESVRRQLPLPA